MPAGFGRPVKCKLYHFRDASMSACGSVSYQHSLLPRPIVGQSRLALIREMTMPRLELSAAVIAVRMDRMLSRELSVAIQEFVFWTDSMIVLQYVYSYSKRFQTFVANRLSVIHDGSMPRQRKVDTRGDPAGDVSRGLNGFEMISSPRWKRGPGFQSLPGPPIQL